MEFDAALARRMLNNSNLRMALGPVEIRDLGGALAITSDVAPIPGLNCLADFDAREASVDALLDIGFGLLRAFDRDPAVEVTPLDRPKSLVKRLERRRLRVTGMRTWMLHRGDPEAIRTNAEVEVLMAAAEDAAIFAQVHGGSERWVRQLSKQTVLAGSLEPGNTFYLGTLHGVPAGTLHMLIDGGMAGIYAVSTLRAYRRQGIASTLMREAIRDARAAGCKEIVLSTDATGDARRLYEEQGFEAAFESQMWTQAAL